LSDATIIELTADVVKAFVANNALPASDLKMLVESVHATFSRLANVVAAPAAPLPVATPTMIRDSVTPDFLISLENGKKYRTLRFHLAKLGLSPEVAFAAGLSDGRGDLCGAPLGARQGQRLRQVSQRQVFARAHQGGPLTVAARLPSTT